LNVDNNERPNNLSLPIPHNYVFTDDFIHDDSLDNTKESLVTGNTEFIGNNDIYDQSGDSFEPDDLANEAQFTPTEE